MHNTGGGGGGQGTGAGAHGAHPGRRRTDYDLRDITGAVIAQHVRIDHDDGTPKEYFWRRNGQNGLGGLAVTALPLYGTEKLAALAPGSLVVVVEGEKACEALWRGNIAAVGTPTGSSTIPDGEVLAVLAGFSVVLWPDNDDGGHRHMAQIAERLADVWITTKVVSWPDAPPKGDAADFEGDDEALATLLDQAVPWAPDAGTTDGADPDADDASPDGPALEGWPKPLADEAFHGLLGELVRRIEPQTEADPAAILITLLVMVGSVIGRGPHALVEATKHDLHEFAVIVGPTSKARKGTGQARARQVIEQVDGSWGACIKKGLTSGEGLIHHVRDPVYVLKDGKSVCVDEGVSDKRLLVEESEFTSVLQVISREGNVLSMTIRDAWDGSTLATLAKNSPRTATGTHISIIGHTTVMEVRRSLTRTEAANGFANRFIWACARRTKCLPEGGDPVYTTDIVDRLTTRIAEARTVGRLRFDDEARAVWHVLYRPLSKAKPGLVGAVVARGEAHVLRLAAIYAVVDGSSVMTAAHLLAAVAVWDYAEASAFCIFRDVLGNPDADRILEALRENPDGLTRTDISEGIFHKNKPARAITDALDELRRAGLAKSDPRPGTGPGRPPERWRANSFVSFVHSYTPLCRETLKRLREDNERNEKTDDN